jgi:hypothetical protein
MRCRVFLKAGWMDLEWSIVLRGRSLLWRSLKAFGMIVDDLPFCCWNQAVGVTAHCGLGHFTILP